METHTLPGKAASLRVVPPAGPGANRRWGARATHSRGYSTRAWRAPPPGKDSPTEAPEAQPSSSLCPIAGWRLAALSGRAPDEGAPWGPPRSSQRAQPPRQPARESPGGPEHHPNGSLFQPETLKRKTSPG